MQERAAPPYLLALVALVADRDATDDLVAEVARDVSRGDGPDPAEESASRAAVEWLLASLRGGPVPDAAALVALRDGAAAEARAGRPLQPVLDRALSAGWVTWDRITARQALGPEALRALGDALLRTGDAAAAAIADGHAAAEREIATRSASALRELLDAILDLPDGDEAGRARLARRAGELAIPLDRPLTVVVADAGRDLQDGDPAVAAVARGLATGLTSPVGDPRSLGGPLPGPVVAASAGRLVVLAPSSRRAADLAGSLAVLGDGWIATTTPASGLLGTAAAVREATAALAVARRAGRVATLVPSASLALERALLAEPDLLRTAVEQELGPLLEAPRGAGLADTMEAYLAERENVRAAARRLGIAPRTVAYRLERIERLLGGRLDAARRARLATALFARRLLGDGGPASGPGGPASGRASGRSGAARAAGAGRSR